MTKSVVTIIIICCLCVEAYNSVEKQKYTLSTSVKPTKYKLILIPYLYTKDKKNFTFDAVVNITFNVFTSIKIITIHANNLEFTKRNCTLYNNDYNIKYGLYKVTFDNVTDFVHFEKTDNRNFPIGSYTLTIYYTGHFHKEQYGFFVSSYIDGNGKNVYYFPSHSGGVGARRLMPCFDEPRFEAIFELIVSINPKYTVVSNMPVNRTMWLYLDNVLEIIEFYFEPTPRMSTYLFAIVISDKKEPSNRYKNIITLIPYGQTICCNFLLKTSESVIKEFEKFADMKYEKGKGNDRVTIIDFSLPVMEKWDLLNYRQGQINFDETSHTISKKIKLVLLVTYQIIHQWFGNIVTNTHWNDLWFNEGITEYLTYYFYGKIDPSLRLVDIFVTREVQNELREDSFPFNNKSIRQNVKNESKISKILDKLNYYEGGALTRMLQHILTEEIFQKCLQNYFKKFYNNSVSLNNLYEAFQEVVDENKLNISVKTIMESWINFEGYPIVTVTRDYFKKTMEIEQIRFNYNEFGSYYDNSHKYHIPINYASTNKLDFENTTPEYWLKNDPLMIKDVDPEQWVILNKQQTGYYRVNYDDRNWDLIINYLNSANRTKIHVLNRAQLLKDALIFARKGLLDVKYLIRLLYTLRSETDYIALIPGYEALVWLANRLRGVRNVYLIFQNFAATIIKPMYELDFEKSENEDSLSELAISEAINVACHSTIFSCLSDTSYKLLKWLNEPKNNTIHPGLKQVIFCNGLKTANYSTWTKIEEKIKLNSTDSDEKAIFLKTTICSDDRNVLKRYYDSYIEDASIFGEYEITQNLKRISNEQFKMFIEYLSNKLDDDENDKGNSEDDKDNSEDNEDNSENDEDYFEDDENDSEDYEDDSKDIADESENNRKKEIFQRNMFYYFAQKMDSEQLRELQFSKIQWISNLTDASITNRENQSVWWTFYNIQKISRTMAEAMKIKN